MRGAGSAAMNASIDSAPSGPLAGEHAHRLGRAGRGRPPCDRRAATGAPCCRPCGRARSCLCASREVLCGMGHEPGDRAVRPVGAPAPDSGADRTGPSRTARSAAAFSAPVASTMISRACSSTGGVIVIRRTPRTGASGAHDDPRALVQRRRTREQATPCDRRRPCPGGSGRTRAPGPRPTRTGRAASRHTCARRVPARRTASARDGPGRVECRRTSAARRTPSGSCSRRRSAAPSARRRSTRARRSTGISARDTGHRPAVRRCGAASCLRPARRRNGHAARPPRWRGGRRARRLRATGRCSSRTREW